MTGKELRDYFVLNMKKSTEFKLIPNSNKTKKDSIEFQLIPEKSKKIREKLNLHKNTKNLFSFITNSTYILFYIKKKHRELITPEIKQRFSDQFEGLNSAGEFTMRLISKDDIKNIIKLLFINKLNSKIPISENVKNRKKSTTDPFKSEPFNSTKSVHIENLKNQNENPKLEMYQPKKVLDLETLKEEENEIDYLEKHRKMMEIGDLAEKIVLKNEIDFLSPDFPKLAEKVRLVSNNPKLGFDVLSFETDGKQKQIEVKAISVNGNSKNFIITRNEFSKSKTYSNYYVYCVSEINSEKPKILRIKNPDFENHIDFFIEPLTYKITFE